VLHSLHLPQHVRQVEGEADFVVLVPGLGVLCVEVKSHLRADYTDGAWYLGDGPSPDYRGPFRQAEMVARSVKRKVASAFPPARGFVFWSAVVFTHCVPAVKAAAGEWHPWQLLTATDLESGKIDVLLESILHRAREHVQGAATARWFDPDSPGPTVADCDEMRRVLRPDVHFLPATSTIRARRSDEIRRYTDEQLAVVDGLDGLNDRALVEGPAGTGKTVLALEEARRAAALGTPAALLCFNRQLAAHLRRDAGSLGVDSVHIATLHALMQEVAGLQPPSGAGAEYWSRQLPDAALAVLLESGPRYGLLIVDEAQDLTIPAYLDVMDALLDGGLARGCWRMFGDFERQAIYADDPLSAIESILERAPHPARFRLRRNCRNTPRVAEYIVRLGGLSPGYSKVLRPDTGPGGTPRTAFYCSAAHQQQLLDEILTELRDSGELAPEDIVVLSPLVDSCAAELDRSGKRRDLEHLPAHRTGASSYGTLAAFKGLEAPAVILTDIGEVATPGAQRLFYVGVSRATDHLRVLARDGLQESVAGLITGVLP
jgi:RecA/RadA recombinase